MESDEQSLTALGSVYNLLDAWSICDVVRSTDYGRATRYVLPSYHARGQFISNNIQKLIDTRVVVKDDPR